MSEYRLPASFLRPLADIADKLPEPNLGDGDAYIGADSQVIVWHKDDFELGRFEVEDDFWMFVEARR